MSEFNLKIVRLQNEIKVSKDNYNAFGKYKYRKCEDIFEAAKKVSKDLGLFIYVSDEIINVGDRFYLVATATITDGENSISNKAYARESLEKKGMDDAQVTGSASSYARKFALSGLLGIDDSKDEDEPSREQKNKAAEKSKNKEVMSSNIEDEKERNMLISNILGGLTELSKGADSEAKGKIMMHYCGVNAFAQIAKTKTTAEMKLIVEKIKAGIKEIDERNKK
jgi:hypothetical protein